MNVYKIERPDIGDYDEYDSAVVIAETEDDARRIHPNGSGDVCDGRYRRKTWVDPSLVIVTLIGVANVGHRRGVVVASFTAG